MRNLFLLVLTILVVVSIATISCSKKEKEEPKQVAIPQYYLKYKVDNQYAGNFYSPIFTAQIIYFDEKGDSVVLENEALPWEKTIMVEKPFTAKMYGRYVVSVVADSLPDTITFGHNANIFWKDNISDFWNYDNNASTHTLPKDRFLELIQSQPTALQFNKIEVLE
ncbi:MAG: hypothetical protein PHR53_00560 [Bacteroidales bacterium]|nr:hypothetical protein [Bacteroidales bacterium]